MKISNFDWIFFKWEFKLNTMAKKTLLDAFDEEENCGFGEIRIDKDKNAISVPILCVDNILKKPKEQRLEIIEKWSLRYLRLFDFIVWTGSKSSEATVNQLKKVFVFDAVATITDQKGNIVDNIKIGSYEFGQKKLASQKE